MMTNFMLNAQDSLNMRRMASLTGLGAEYNDVWGYKYGSEEFAVIGSNNAVNVVNVTDCQNPSLVAQWIDGSSVIWRDFKDYGDYIYAICDGGACQEGLQVISKKDYTHTQSLAQFRAAHNIFIDKNAGRLYVVGANTFGSGIILYDIKTDPANPIHLGNFNTIDYIHDLYVENDTVYASNIYTGMFRIWDFKNLSNTILIGDLYRGGYNHSNWKHPSQDYIYTATETHGKPLEVYDISDPTEPLDILQFQDPLLEDFADDYLAHNPYVYLNRLYISNYHDGVKVYDVSDGANPDLIGYYDTYPDNTNYNGYEGCWGIYPALPSGCILAADITYGLQTFKMTISPEAKTVFSKDIVIDNADYGIVLVTKNNDAYRLTVDSDGIVNSSLLSAIPSEKVSIRNSNISFDSSNYGVVLKAPNGKYFRLKTDISGTLITESLDLSMTETIIQNSDLLFTQYKSALMFQDSNGDCHEFTINDSGVFSSEACD